MELFGFQHIYSPIINAPIIINSMDLLENAYKQEITEDAITKASNNKLFREARSVVATFWYDSVIFLFLIRFSTGLRVLFVSLSINKLLP
jgi:hypothetical protein